MCQDHTPEASPRSLTPTRRQVLGGTLAAGGLSLAGIGVASSASAAAVARPSLISCATWGAAPATEPVVMVGPPTKIVVHHTASANTTDYSVAAAHSIARKIQQWHFERGWIDSGQHFTISRGGYILEGRHRTIEGLKSGSSSVFPQGAHCTGQNPTSLGIETEGTYTTGTPRAPQWDALVNLSAYLCQTYGIAPSAIYGHRDFVATSCPGDDFYAKIASLRSAVAAKIGGSTTRAWPVLAAGASGYRVVAARYLLRHSGRTIAVSGAFDTAMTTVVGSFQQAKGLGADGVIGRLTWESPLAVTCRQGTTALDSVRGMQTALNANGQTLTVDGIFGSGTATAVRAFQTSRGMPPDAVVGLDTWAALLD